MNTNAKMEKTQLPYRPCVGIMLLNAENKVWVGQRINQSDQYSNAWQMPQGGIDHGEDPRDAAFRELEEEIGTASAIILAQTQCWLYYELPDHLLGHIWRGKYRGQKQKWFAMRFTGQDSEVNISTKQPEFSAWQWLDMSDLVKNIVPFKKAVYAEVVESFAYLKANERR